MNNFQFNDYRETHQDKHQKKDSDERIRGLSTSQINPKISQVSMSPYTTPPLPYIPSLINFFNFYYGFANSATSLVLTTSTFFPFYPF